MLTFLRKLFRLFSCRFSHGTVQSHGAQLLISDSVAPPARPLNRVILSALGVILTWNIATIQASHLPPVTPVLPFTDHSHEDHGGLDYTAGDLRGVLFIEADLRGALFRNANLSAANLHNAFIDLTDFTGATLVGAQIRNRESTGAIFRDANLNEVDFDDSFFAAADFRGATFTGSRLFEFTSTHGNFRGADLSDALGIEGAVFSGDIYDGETRFPIGFDPVAAGMLLVPEPSPIIVLGGVALLAGLWFLGRRIVGVIRKRESLRRSMWTARRRRTVHRRIDLRPEPLRASRVAKRQTESHTGCCRREGGAGVKSGGFPRSGKEAGYGRVRSFGRP